MEISGLRVDIDTVADARAIPKVLEILKEKDVKASFFITMGPDRAGRNLPKYLFKPLKDKVEAARRFGIKNLILGMTPFAPRMEGLDYTGIVEEGHEIGLHGYDHFSWIRRVETMREGEIKREIDKGRRAFKKVFGRYPDCFASPGFKRSPSYLRALDSFDFKYSSDFIGTGILPHYPLIKEGRAKTLQVPVAMESIGELRRGYLDRKIFRKRMKYFTFYIHPSYEAVYEEKLLSKALDMGEFSTLGEIAEAWNEDPPDI